MEEKVIVKSETYATLLLYVFMIVGGVISLFSFTSFYGANVFDGIFSCLIISMIPFSLLSIIGVFLYFCLLCEMVVTDKRVYGQVAWGERVDLPMDSISATGTLRLFKGVTVSTSSGKISFWCLKNSDEIYEKVNALLVERQKKQKEAAPVQPSAPTVSVADELKKFKDLLDQGIITQEEFDAKKKELLGL